MMAKITIELDTELRSMSVMLNGAAIDNVKNVTCYSVDADEEKEYGYKQTMCCIYKASEEDDVKRYEQICAGENEFSVKKDEELSATAKDLSTFFKQNLSKLR